jgi:hypothetical protein
MTLRYEWENFRRGLRERRPTQPRGPFGSVEWAWPTGGRDLLLRAAILEDIPEAVRALREWMTTHELEDIHFAEQRLVVAISHRMPEGALEGREKTRLGGVERMLWSHCVVAFREAKLALAALGDAGIEMIVFRGAARSVLDISNLRGRYASEIDILVHPTDFERAIGAVLAAGWGWRGGKAKNLKRLTGMNLLHGRFGEVDIHRYAYRHLIASDANPDDLWGRATRHEFLGQTVGVPSGTDRLLIALAHGSIDGHANSDWLVDAALLIRDGEVDWALFERLALQRDLATGALIGLSYLAGPLKLPVPADLLARLEAASRRKPIRRALALLEARPKREHSTISAIGRWIARVVRHVRYDTVLARLTHNGG